MQRRVPRSQGSRSTPRHPAPPDVRRAPLASRRRRARLARPAPDDRQRGPRRARPPAAAPPRRRPRGHARQGLARQLRRLLPDGGAPPAGHAAALPRRLREAARRAVRGRCPSPSASGDGEDRRKADGGDRSTSRPSSTSAAWCPRSTRWTSSSPTPPRAGRRPGCAPTPRAARSSRPPRTFSPPFPPRPERKAGPFPPRHALTA